MINPHKAFSIAKLVFEVIVAFHLVSSAAHAAIDFFGMHDPIELWAWSFGLWVSVSYMLIMLCLWRNGIYQDRIEDCAAAKARLEQQMLKNRQSSNKTGKDKRLSV